MIERAAEARNKADVKDMTEYLAGENSWRLSENFEKNCKERRQFDLDDDLSFSMDMHSDQDECQACNNGLS